MRNLRAILAVERSGRWMQPTRGSSPCLPGGNVREGESLRYALSRIARETCGAQIRVRGIAAIAEREGSRPADRCIEVYVRASLVGGYDKNRQTWATAQGLRDAGLEASVVDALERTGSVPYLGNVLADSHRQGMRTPRRTGH